MENKVNMNYEHNVRNPYPEESQSRTAYKKGFFECLELMQNKNNFELLFSFAKWYNPIYQNQGHGISERVIEDFVKQHSK